MAIRYDYAEYVPLSNPAIIQENVFHDLVANVRPTGLECELPARVTGNHFFDLDQSPTPAVETTFIEPTADSVIYRRNQFWNTGFAMEADWSADARWNWWGDSTGPYHSTSNPEGLGDTIVGAFQFEPWYQDSSLTEAVDERFDVPKEFDLTVFPNPFNSSAKLRLRVPEAVIVRVDLYNTLGQKVDELFSGAIGLEKEIIIDAGELPSGVYFARVTDRIFNRVLATEKLALVR